MRQVICDVCGRIKTIGVDRDMGTFITNQAGKMPDDWDTIFVKRSVKKDGVVDLCPDCIDKYNAVYSGAQNTMYATVDSWMRIQLYGDKEEKDENNS